MAHYISRHGRITVRSVDALISGEQLWDTDIKGFVVRHRAQARVYAVKCRISGRQRWVTIGEHGVFTPDKARTEAIRIKGTIAGGDDPTVKRDELKRALIFREVAEQFLDEYCGLLNAKDLGAKFATSPGAPVKPGTARGYRDGLRDHVLPVLGKRPVESVTTAELSAIHTRMRKHPYAANRVLSIVSTMHSWARLNKLWKGSNPTEGIGRYNEKTRTKFLDNDETRRVVQAISDAEAGVPLDRVPMYRAKRQKLKAKRPAAVVRLAHHKPPGPSVSETAGIDTYSAAAIRFLLLTGLRPKEALSLRWSHVNFSTAMVHLPATKTGPRDATLSTQALEFLGTVPKLDSNPFVFCGRKPGRPLASLQHAFQLVRELAGFGNDDDVVLYTVRHNFGSTLAAQRVEAYELMKMMGHKNLSTSLRYIHLAQSGIQATASRATAGISDALKAVKQRPAAELLEPCPTGLQQLNDEGVSIAAATRGKAG